MKKYILSILALAAIAFVGCEKDDIDDAGGKQISGQVINFGAGALESRTIYESTDSKQIHWQTGDKVRIYCAQAIGGVTNVENSGDAVAYADYAVTVNATDKSFATIALAEGSSPLLWGGSGIAHKFYAVYPHDAAVDVSDDGVVTFPINRNQICYIQTDAEKKADADASKYTYVARPDMSNAYMVASSEANPVDYVSNGTDHNNVWLDFKPIMTTINIVVKGPQNLVNGQPDSNTTADPSLVTGVSIISTITTNTTASMSQFVYDIEKAMITGSQAGTGTASEQTETTFISPRNSDGLDAVTLKQGETLCLTAFLPPMAETTAEALNRDIKIRVHTTGGNKTLSLEDATALLPSAKGAIKLPAMYTPITNSNWITPLDGNIYVSQLSIPGTHDACTGDGTSYSIGKTQDINLKAQWDMGIRCFDLRPRYGREDNATVDGDTVHNLWINHGSVSTTWSMDAAVASFKEWLEANPGEFAIIIMRHEDEGDGDGDPWADTMADALADYAKMTNKTTGEGLTVNFKPDLTIDECRGKILFMMRSWTSYTGGPTVGGYHSWSHDAAAVECEIWGPGSSVGKLYVQDYYNLDLGFTIIPNYFATEGTAIYNKQNAICDMLDLAVKTHTNDDWKNVWFYNHTSGYIYYTIFGAGVATTDGYRGNAANNNPLVYNYLLGNTVTINGTSRTKPVGSTGIVIMDFVGARSSSGTTVYGDLCPQVIIDNNYKYRMKRKGE